MIFQIFRHGINVTVLTLKSNQMITPKLNVFFIRMTDLLVTLFDCVQMFDLEIRCQFKRYAAAHHTVGVWVAQSTFQMTLVARDLQVVAFASSFEFWQGHYILIIFSVCFTSNYRYSADCGMGVWYICAVRFGVRLTVAVVWQCRVSVDCRCGVCGVNFGLFCFHFYHTAAKTQFYINFCLRDSNIFILVFAPFFGKSSR